MEYLKNHNINQKDFYNLTYKQLLFLNELTEEELNDIFKDYKPKDYNIINNIIKKINKNIKEKELKEKELKVKNKEKEEQKYNLKRYFDKNNINIKKLYDLQVAYFVYLNTLTEDKLNDIFKDYNENDKEMINKIKLNVDKVYDVEFEDFMCDFIDDYKNEFNNEYKYIKVIDIIKILFNEDIKKLTIDINYNIDKEKYYNNHNYLYENYFYSLSINELFEILDKKHYYNLFEYYILYNKDDDKDKYEEIFDYVYEQIYRERDLKKDKVKTKAKKRYKNSLYNINDINQLNNIFNKLSHYNFYIKSNFPSDSIKYLKDNDLIGYCQLSFILPYLQRKYDEEFDNLENLIFDLLKRK